MQSERSIDKDNKIVFKEVFDAKLSRGDEPSGVNWPLLEGTPEHSFRNVPKKVRLWSTREVHYRQGIRIVIICCRRCD